MLRIWRRRRRQIEVVTRLLVALDVAASDPRRDLPRRDGRTWLGAAG